MSRPVARMMKLTSAAGPTIWEGKTDCGRKIWIQYAAGQLDAWIGESHLESTYELLMRLPDLRIQTMDLLGRWISLQEIINRTRDHINWTLFEEDNEP